MKKRWTQETIDRAKFNGKEVWHSIHDCTGLSCVIQTDGKFWVWRMTRRGQKFHEHIGTIKDISLDEAKRSANNFRKNLLNGFQPRYNRFIKSQITLQQAYEEYISSADFICESQITNKTLNIEWRNM